MDDGGEDGSSKTRAFFHAARYASLGLEMGLAVAIGAGIGWALDCWLGTKPWMLLVFLLFGIAAGFKGLIDAARKASAEIKASNPRRTNDGPDDGPDTAGKN